MRVCIARKHSKKVLGSSRHLPTASESNSDATEMQTYRHADAIVISSSSDTGEASKDSTLQSDVDSPSKHKADEEHQQWRLWHVQSPELTPKTPRTPDSGRRKRRVKEYSGYQESPRSSRRTGRRSRVNYEMIALDQEDEDEQSLFVSEASSWSQPIIVDNEPGHEDRLYNGMTPERVRRVKEYLNALNLMETADSHLQPTKNELNSATTEHTNLSWKLATIDATANNTLGHYSEKA
ncbi:hypothetical protein BU25DRAFT_422021 [Macroventuria anomochaeta]|uniref:Uncharacterized protein n=1 Tax=Macroventuria anomochaeta TaxID=301207 RepID=A0ACB6RYN2_9PLEO|nr:uncharacterized protein BU25DRAFT_422021 [Macroventuria anomochaeta]KAF2627140.1 hypothetical protein BU25DRAFT_422021 [Macroventuria anomochaeta]